MTDRLARATASLKALYADPTYRARLLEARHGAALWTPEEDARLIAMRSDGLPYTAIATALGRTDDAAIGRYHRLQKETAR